MNYVLSDIHGNQRRFHSILEQIGLQPEDTLYILGDVIDRHPDGIRILREIMAMTNVKMLLGNHEYMMMRALGDPYDGPEDILGADPYKLLGLWYRNHGDVTHAHWKHIRKAVRADILDYLKALPLNIDITVEGKQYKLVHAAPVDAFDPLSMSGSLTHFAVWDRKAVLRLFDTDYITIFGHTSTMHFQDADPLEIWHNRDVICVDCGSGYPNRRGEQDCPVQGRLGCLRLEDMREFYSQEDI